MNPMSFQPGDKVKVLCSAQQGAFPTEYLIVVQTTNGPVLGFVQAEYIEKQSDRWYASGVVSSRTGDKYVVRLPGSFATINGFASFRSDDLIAP